MRVTWICLTKPSRRLVLRSVVNLQLWPSFLFHQMYLFHSMYHRNATSFIRSVCTLLMITLSTLEQHIICPSFIECQPIQYAIGLTLITVKLVIYLSRSSIHSTSQYCYANKIVVTRHDNTHPRTDSCTKYVHYASINIRNEVPIVR